MMQNGKPVANPRPFGQDAEQEPETDPTDPQAEGEPATPEEQAQYDLVVARAMKFMHGEGRDQTLKMLGSGETPAQSIGATAAMIAKAIKQSADQAGKPIDPDVLFHAGAEIVEELSAYGEAAGVFQFASPEESERQTEEGLFHALKIYGEGEIASGEADQEAAMRTVQEQLAQERARGGVAEDGSAAMNGVAGAVSDAVNPPQIQPGAAAVTNPGLIRKQMGV